MQKSCDESLIDFSKRGIIVGPNEEKNIFFNRAEKLKKKEQFIDFTSINIAYQVRPDWVEIEYSNKGLHFWEAACVWQDQPKMQLKPIFLKKNYLGYSRKELIDHELVHLVRSEFHSPIFEEVLAYQSSKRLRKYFGPIVRNPRESKGFVFFLAIIALFSFWSPFSILLLLPILGYAFYRLWRTQSIFQKARKVLSSVANDTLALPILLRLTDEEIQTIAKLHQSKVQEYLKKREGSLRIRQLFLHLLPDFLD